MGGGSSQRVFKGPGSEFLLHLAQEKRGEFGFEPKLARCVVQKVASAGTWRCVQEDHPER